MPDQTVILFTVWNMNGSPLSAFAQETIEQALEQAIKSIEKKENTRLLYQKVAE